MPGCRVRPRTIGDRMSNANSTATLVALIPPDWITPEDRLAATAIEAGMSGAAVFRIDASPQEAHFLKIAELDDADALRQEIVRTGWLSAHGIPVPRLLRTLDTPDVVAMLTAELPGVAVADCDRPTDDVIGIIARAFATLHALPAAACPFDESVAARMARARALVARGGVDAADFASRNRLLTPQQISTGSRCNCRTAPTRSSSTVTRPSATCGSTGPERCICSIAALPAAATATSTSR